MRICTVTKSVSGSGRGEIAVQDGDRFHFVAFSVENDEAAFESKFPLIPVPQDVLDFCSRFIEAVSPFWGD